MLERGPLHTGGFPTPSVRHWIVSPVGEGAKEVSRPEGQDVEALPDQGPRDTADLQRQQFGGGNRHYLGVQFVLWDGQLVITLMITVTVLHETLRIEVTGHALGPVHPLFTDQARRPRRRRSPRPSGSGRPRRRCRWWSRRRWCGSPRAPPSPGIPPLLDFLGGKLMLPEPFGLRHAWADKPWRHRFMADDALRAATPVLRVVHAAAMGCSRRTAWTPSASATAPWSLSGLVQDADAHEGRPLRRVGVGRPAAAGSAAGAGGRGPTVAGQASASILRVSASSWGSTLVGRRRA